MSRQHSLIHVKMLRAINKYYEKLFSLIIACSVKCLIEIGYRVSFRWGFSTREKSFFCGFVVPTGLGGEQSALADSVGNENWYPVLPLFLFF